MKKALEVIVFERLVSFMVIIPQQVTGKFFDAFKKEFKNSRTARSQTMLRRYEIDHESWPWEITVAATEQRKLRSFFKRFAKAQSLSLQNGLGTAPLSKL